jgi:SAM-dependent methyltransferase
VEDGIVRFLQPRESDGLDSELKSREMRSRDADAEEYDTHSASFRKRLEQEAVLRSLRLTPSDFVAELGCGTGATTMRYAHLVARTVAVDFSFRSLQLLRRKLPSAVRDRVLLAQADVCHPPLARGVFHKAVSTQVLEHVPTAEGRLQAVRAAAGLLRRDGSFVCTVYNWSRQKQKDAAAGDTESFKEGFHLTGIYYYNFDRHDFRELLVGGGMAIEFVRGIASPYPGARLLGPLRGTVDRVLSLSPLGASAGHLLLARTRPQASPA